MCVQWRNIKVYARNPPVFPHFLRPTTFAGATICTRFVRKNTHATEQKKTRSISNAHVSLPHQPNRGRTLLLTPGISRPSGLMDASTHAHPRPARSYVCVCVFCARECLFFYVSSGHCNTHKARAPTHTHTMPDFYARRKAFQLTWGLGVGLEDSMNSTRLLVR